MNPAGFALIALLPVLTAGAGNAQSLRETNTALLKKLQVERALSADSINRIARILARSGIAGQGNPLISSHPLSEAECRRRAGTGPDSVLVQNPRFQAICGGPNLVPLYDPKTQQPEDAKVCIDKFEFPNLACTYPVVWVKASEAAQICAAEGERLCDAHEWEGACQGNLQPPDYRFDLARGKDSESAVELMRAVHNNKYAKSKRWSYGKAYQPGVCAANSSKTPGCDGGSYGKCGSNTYPTGSFKTCKSPLGVFDLNGNAAEHMNLPLAPDQMASAGSRKLGVTEMKGSWFIFDKFRAHPDWCRWRAPFWHGTRVLSPQSHANYHLGFRCCKTLE